MFLITGKNVNVSQKVHFQQWMTQTTLVLALHLYEKATLLFSILSKKERRLCFHPCPFALFARYLVGLSVSRITQKLQNEYALNLVEGRDTGHERIQAVDPGIYYDFLLNCTFLFTSTLISKGIINGPRYKK